MEIVAALRRAADELARIHEQYPDHERMPVDAQRMLAWVHLTCLQTSSLLTPIIGEQLANHNIAQVRHKLDLIERG